MKPMPKKPRISIDQVEGSGTAAMLKVPLPLKVPVRGIFACTPLA
jgi:hypothetical protein